MSSARPPLRPVDEVGAEAVAQALRLDGFFPEFNAELCAKVFPRSGMHQYAHGEVLIEQGESGRDLFVILAGRVAITQSFGSASAQLAVLERGALVGEMALLSDGQRRASALAEGAVLAFRLDHSDVGYILSNNADLAAHLQALARQRAS